MSYERRGGPRMLSATEAERILSIPCFTILAGITEPVFPQSDRASPSPMVLIVRTRTTRVNIPEILSCAFPVAVDWRQWREAVVPVLEDERWGTTNAVVSSALSTGRTSEVLDEIGVALRQSFEAAGYAAGDSG